MSGSNALEPRLLAALSRILTGLPAAGPTLSGLLEFCARELEPLVPRLYATFAFAQGAGRELVLRAVPADPTVPLEAGTPLLAPEGDVLERLMAKEPVIVRLQEDADAGAMTTLARAGFRTLLIVPLITEGGDLLGSWNLASRNDDAFSATELDILQHLGEVVALAASRAHLRLRLQQQTEQLIESEKLAAVGRLVAGVAHELGGPLQAVISLAEVLNRDPDRPDRIESANRILRSALRCRGMVQDLLTYARKQPHQLVPVQVSDSVMDALELDRFSDVGEVQIHFDGDDDVPAVLADHQRLTQVFLNLVTNARHATAHDGRPGLVRVRVKQLPADRSRLDLPLDATVVQVAVEDQGSGVPEELRESIFEPFVTTKPEGAGTGLGLSVSRSLIMDMGGSLYLDTDHVGGARFVVELPATDQPAGERRATPASRPSVGGHRILLIDDDREILETYEVILSLDDHFVFSCDRGRKALDLLREEEFDAILCDIRLPDIRGPEFLERLREFAPDQADRVIFATGDVVNDQTRAFLASTSNPSLIKPFQVEDLERAIHEIVGRSR